MAARLKKGDKVVVISGRAKGQSGIISFVNTQKQTALVDNVNVAVKHEKKSAKSEGGRVRKAAPLHLSNLAFIDPEAGVATRIGFKFDDDGKKVRYAKKSGVSISD